MKSKSKSTKRIIKFFNRKDVKLFITFSIIYIYFINWYGWNEESNFALTRAIVEENRFEIDSFYNLTGDRSVYQNHYYSDKGPGLSFLASPSYAVWKFIYYNFFPKSFVKAHEASEAYVTTFNGNVPIYTYVDPGFFILNSMLLVTAFTSSVFTALTAVLVYKISKKIIKNERYRVAATVAYALGTLAFPYALHFMSHAVGAFFAFFAFYLLFKEKMLKKSPDSTIFFLSGLFIGLAVVVENFIILIIPLFLVYATLVSIRKSYKIGSLLFFSALIIGIMPLTLYNYIIFGNPLDFSSAHIDREIYRSAYFEQPFKFISFDITTLDVVNRAETHRFVKYSFSRSSMLSQLLSQLFRHFHLIPSPNYYIFTRLLIGPYRGLFFYSPVLLISLLGLYWMFKKHKLEAIFIILILLTFLFIISMRSNWWGGYCFGNRYLATVVPFLTVPMLYVFSRLSKFNRLNKFVRFNYKFVKFLIVSLLSLSIFINFLGLQPAEDYAYDWSYMNMRSDWAEKENSFQTFYSPLVEHYWPNFLKGGPRSPLFENIVNGYTSIDIRMPALSKGVEFPFSEFHIPFLCLAPLIVIISLVWRKELISELNLFRKMLVG